MSEAWHNLVAFGATITWVLMLWELRRARKVNGALARWLNEAMDWTEAVEKLEAEGVQVKDGAA